MCKCFQVRWPTVQHDFTTVIKVGDLLIKSSIDAALFVHEIKAWLGTDNIISSARPAVEDDHKSCQMTDQVMVAVGWQHVQYQMNT